MTSSYRCGGCGFEAPANRFRWKARARRFFPTGHRVRTMLCPQCHCETEHPERSGELVDIAELKAGRIRAA